MAKRMGWIVGALVTALWVAPAVAQTGATSDSARAGTGAATTAPTKSGDPQGVPSGSTTDPSAKGPSGGSVAGEKGSGGSSGTGSSATSSGTDRTTAIGTDTSSSTSTAPPTSTSGASNSETGKPGPSDTATDRSSAARSTSGTSGGRSSAQSSDTLQKLHAGNQAEIEAGRWMQEHAQNSRVKDFAKKMVKDHTDMDKDVQQFAQKQGISLTGGAAAKDQQDLQMMQQMPAGQADRHYMTMMVDDHRRDVSEVRSAADQAKSSNDKELAKLLDKTAKKMDDHLKDAQKIQHDMGSRQARTPGQQ